ncbi:hypothetical protein SPSIL_015330 [Sporomusa silvacetica DSM 10669]|uniref:Uncharacterized protein n=1 Tax=Sporomusa silvacetica DSM 10669 TaxID=1123289 RepID=A0ABZ3IJ38_9FIRM|nr:hypothetical protein [Sporomusa silvacetica]OZC21595.1 hypothetical protein SPSIL_10060 [Sporomusa silvacetica DSM 10669]
MPVYRVFINNKDTGDFVTASNPQDAYYDVSAAIPLTYKDHVELQEVVHDAGPGFPIGNHTIQASTSSTLEQELFIERPEGSE